MQLQGNWLHPNGNLLELRPEPFMKLFYYKDPIGNFGDDLNPWIWYNLVPEIFDDDDEVVLVGIGTLINSRAPTRPTKLVFGSGVGYHQFPEMDDKWKFYCVRGPLSAERLGLDRSYAITDPAVLITQLVSKQPVQRSNAVCFMPHHASARFADWQSICEQAGITYIDPAADLNEAIFQIRRCRLFLAEAMHGAIVADAFRVPWIPVACYDHILDFKWQDWCLSLNLEYRPKTVPSIWDMERDFSLSTHLKTRIKRGLRLCGIWTSNWTPPVPATNRQEMEGQVIETMMRLANCDTQFLSSDRDHFESIERLLERLDQLKRDCLASQVRSMTNVIPGLRTVR